MLKHFTKVAATAALLALPVASWAQDFTIRATANSNENDEDYDGLIVFKNYVEAPSNGRIAVELFIGTQLCATGAECLEGVAEGSIDVYISTSGGAAGIFPYVQVLDLPYLMANDRVAEHVLTGDFVRTMRDMALETSDNTIRLMTIGNTGGWRNFANTQRRVAQPSDMEGLKIRTVVADLPQELVRALGASPTDIQVDEFFRCDGLRGWGVELAKFFNRGVSVYDQETDRWLTWDGHDWNEEEEPVVPDVTFSATGTRHLTDFGRQAIHDMFKRSFGGQ